MDLTLGKLWQGALMAAAILLSGCSANDSDAPPQANEQRAQVLDGVLSYPASDYYQRAPGKPGGTLKVSVALDTGTFDIHALAHGNVQWLGRLLFDALVYQDEQGGISPWLAKSWDISPDGTRYTFHLRDDVTFSDGTPFNAEAVRVNLEHMRDPDTKSPLTAAYIAPYASGRVVDDYTFEATLKEPYSAFLSVLAQSWLSMISPKQILEAPKSIAEHPIGSGPFLLQHYNRAQNAIFVRRDDYHWAPPVTRHQGPAYLQRIELNIVPEAIIRYGTLVSGQDDFTLDAPPQNAVAIRANPELEFSSSIRKGNPNRSVTFNVERYPFDDVRVRKAFTQAIDREGLAWIIGFGEYQLTSDFLAVNTPYYDSAFSHALQYDPVAAAKLLDEAGWSERDAEGFRVKQGKRFQVSLSFTDNATFPGSAGVAIQADARKVGIDLQLKVLPLLQAMEARYRSDFDLFGGGYWHSNTPDGLFMLYHSDSIPGARLIGQNVGRLRDAKLDQLLSDARRSQSPEQLKQLYAQAQQRLTELVPAAPVYESQHLIAYHRYVKGLVFDTSHNTPLFTSVWLDKEQP
ncbi:ABC transporter substrate-binding protein [Pseudomonas sp. 5P_3.1_Bac2]|uniref:ABC transporter substrate-binding protein n=1 Tax=Pseudomonas sp. 5P_3.1_Bac2 TaxID=2971617 RepID=UPI0021C96306|nr:ABC transporter substrate-binding protein [Pseudomonas sp. 5P_3.1_Bac2]MCU1717234.1 ABC transporter substrate-binding protein [Pseudomonas sp. 5P_3.1_Bac2]